MKILAIRGRNLALNSSGLSGSGIFHELRFGFTQLRTRFDIPFEENWNRRLGILGGRA